MNRRILPNKILLEESSNTNDDKDLIGYSVIDKTKGDIGTVSDIDKQTSQKLIVIKNIALKIEEIML